MLCAVQVAPRMGADFAVGLSMLQIAVWGLAGVVGVLSTLPAFIVRSRETTAVDRVSAFAVLAFGFALAAFLVWAVAEQAGAAFGGAGYDPPSISPGSLNNPLTVQ